MRFFFDLRVNTLPAFNSILKITFHSLIGKKLILLDSFSLIHTFMESLPQAVLQAGAIVVKSLVNNDRQCFYPKEVLEWWIRLAGTGRLNSK